MKRLLILFAIIILLVLPGCFSIPIVPLGIRYKDEIFSRVDVTKDVIYGQNYDFDNRFVELTMDVCEPHGDIAEKRALIVFIHGGGFVSGDKGSGQWVEFCTTFSKRGYVTASINYRLQPQGNVDYELAITQAMHDAKAAVRYFRANSSLWRINEEKIALVGGSAGAVTSLYTTYLTEVQYEGDSGNPGYSSNVSACVDLWGGLYNNVGEINIGESPVLIIHGTEDEIVHFSEAVNISDRCNEVDVYCEMRALDGEGHAPWNIGKSFLPWIVDFLYDKVGGLLVNIASTDVSGFTYSDGSLSNAVGSNEEIPNDDASMLIHFGELRNPFGVAFGEMFRGEEFMPYIRDLGVNITKMSLHWYQIEPQNNVYDRTLVDAYVDQLHEDDEVLLNIFTSSDWGAEGKGKGYPPLDYDEYYDFIYDLVEYTNGKIKYWQRDTEPASRNHWDKNKPEEYVETQKYFYNAVKAANPDAVVIGVNQNGFFTSEGEPENKEFFEYVISEGKDYFDILDIRLYGDKYTISERVQWFRDKMNEYGYEKPIFTTEYAGPTPFEFPVKYASFQEKYNRLPEPLFLIWIYLQKWTGRLSPQMEMFLDDIDLGLGLLKNHFTDQELEEKRHRIQCRDITARTVLALSGGVEKCWWWNLIANDQPILGIHHPIFGKLRLMEIEDWSKRPAYYAFQRMTDKLDGISSIEQIDVGNENIFLFEIEKADTSITYVLWEKRDLFYGEEQPSTAFEFNCEFSMARITDVFGSEEILDTENDVLKLDISDTPIFIEEVAMVNESSIENEGVLLGVSPDGKGWLEEIDGQLVLHLSGTGYEMGYQHGYLLKEEIKRTINAYVYHGSESTGNPPASAKTVWNNVKPYVPQRYLDEMQGLADGVGIPLIDVQVMQVQAELESIFLCEQIAVWGSATVDGDLYHGRNFGFPIDKRDDSSGVAIQDHAIVIIAQPEGYNDLVLLSWPGFIGACNGMNDKGISLAINAGFNSIWNPGLARALRFRRALEEADDIDRAVNILDHDKTVGGMLTLSDGKVPKAYAVEMHGQSLYAGEWNDPAEEHDGYYSIKDCVRRMNQYINPGLAETQTTPEGKTIGLRPPSQEYFAVSEFIEDYHGEMNLDLMKEVLITKTSHQGAEGGCVRTSICRGSTLDFWVADAVGSSSSVDQNFYYYNLNTLLSSTIPDGADDVMPQVAITSPAGGRTVTGVVTIAGTASDNIGVSSVEIMVDDDGYSLTDGTTTWSKAIDTSGWEKGSWHRIKVRAIDESGNGNIAIIGLKKKGGKGLEEISWGNESKFIEETIDILDDNENDNTDATTEIYPGNCDGSKNVYLSTRISSQTTDSQINFVNSHYGAVMTSLLDSQVREKIQGPLLFLYRSIQGTWTDFDQFDWNHINANENMFCHNTSPENPHPNNRILTICNSWLMDGNDLVDENDSNALNHWINYYALTALEQVHSFDYDGLFIDSASHALQPGFFYGLLPDDHSDDSWRDGRYAALEFIKSYLPDKIVVFNGLHGGNGAEHSLTLTDGGLWETFAFRPSTSTYQGKEKWTEAIELTQRNKDESLIAISSKKNNLINDIQSRMFILSSYLLVSNQNVYLTMIDLNYDEFKSIYYYPEYELELGAPLNNYTVDNNGLYRRDFEKGIALVNPSDTESLSYTLDKKYHKVIPVGGGVLQDDGTCNGFLNYEFVEDEIILSPISGVVLLNEDQINLTINIEKPKGNRLYVFNKAMMPLKNTIILGKITIQTEVYSINDMDRVEFYIDDVLKSTDDELPYEWTWNKFAMGNHEVKVVAYDGDGNEAAEKIEVKIFNLGV